jgi:hypothetical protein
VGLSGFLYSEAYKAEAQRYVNGEFEEQEWHEHMMKKSWSAEDFIYISDGEYSTEPIEPIEMTEEERRLAQEAMKEIRRRHEEDMKLYDEQLRAASENG